MASGKSYVDMEMQIYHSLLVLNSSTIRAETFYRESGQLKFCPEFLVFHNYPRT
jgi:hypothetical protein